MHGFRNNNSWVRKAKHSESTIYSKYSKPTKIIFCHYFVSVTNSLKIFIQYENLHFIRIYADLEDPVLAKLFFCCKNYMMMHSQLDAINVNYYVLRASVRHKRATCKFVHWWLSFMPFLPGCERTYKRFNSGRFSLISKIYDYISSHKFKMVHFIETSEG